MHTRLVRGLDVMHTLVVAIEPDLRHAPRFAVDPVVAAHGVTAGPTVVRGMCRADSAMPRSVGASRVDGRADHVDAVDRVEPAGEDEPFGDRARDVSAVPEVGQAVERLGGDDPRDLCLADSFDVGEREPDAVGAAVR
jgi:hypothetical protein